MRKRKIIVGLNKGVITMMIIHDRTGTRLQPTGRDMRTKKNRAKTKKSGN
jgi:hypothetical protein